MLLIEEINRAKAAAVFGDVFQLLDREDGQSLSAKESVSINWLNENIVGYIPDISELKDEAVDLVRVQGINVGADAEKSADKTSSEEDGGEES